MDDYINRFRTKVGIENAASARIGDIIAQSLSRIEVLLERLQKAIPVIFINKDKEGGNESIMYSYKTDGVQIGDYVTAFDKSHLVYKEVRNLKREDYIDCWNTVMCNINFNLGSNTIKAYFRGPLRMVQSEEEDLKMNLGIDSKQDSYIVVPVGVNLNINDQISINSQGWRVVGKDISTNPGIAYIALEEYAIVNLTKISETSDPDYKPAVSTDLLSGVEYTLETEDGFIQIDRPVILVSRTLTEIKFIAPIEPGSLSITIKKDGINVTTVYTVRS